MRGTVAKRLRRDASNQVTLKAKAENREIAKGEFKGLVKHKKRKYNQTVIVTKLKTSAHQKRKPGMLYGSSARYRDRPMDKSGTTMRINVKKMPAPIYITPKKTRRFSNQPQNKVIIFWKHATSPPAYERFSGVKTEAAARKIFSKRNVLKIKSATWWNHKREPLNLMIFAKDLVTE